MLLYYPDAKKEYAMLYEKIVTSANDNSGGDSGFGSGTFDPTSIAAIRLVNNKRMARLELEIEAVETTLADLNDCQREVIQRRFWGRQSRRIHKPQPYDYLQDLPFSERQMHRIVRDTIFRIAQMIGEV